MRKSSLRDLLRACWPAVAYLLLRRAGEHLPPAAEIALFCVIFAAAVFLYRREKDTCVSRRFQPGQAGVPACGKGPRAGGALADFRRCLPWILIGAACGGLNRLCFGRPAGAASGFPAFLLLCLLGPLSEETVYRGLVYGRCLRFLPAWGAMVLSALLFAAAHGSPLRMAAAFAAGMLFALARSKTGTVAVPALMHILMNLAVFC